MQKNNFRKKFGVIVVSLVMMFTLLNTTIFADKNRQQPLESYHIVAWGLNNYGQCSVPLPNSNFTDVTAGYYHSLGLKENGSIIAWGLNGDGQCSVPSPNSNFIATAAGGYYSLGLRNIPPNLPNNSNPGNNTTGIDINTNLYWNCTDPDNDSLTYDVYFGTSNNPSLVSSGQINTTYDPGTLNPGTIYYWKIKAFDDCGANTTGPLWCFTTYINNPPNEPCDPNPANEETGVDINASLSWNCSDPENDSITFDVYFGTNSNPPSVSSNQTENYYDPPGAIQYNTLYYWKIIVWDYYNSSNTSTIWDFTTGNEPNNPPIKPIISEENNTLFVYSFDQDGDDIYYFVDWDDGTTSDWLGPHTSGVLVEISHKWSEPGVYYIKAKARDTNGAVSSWSDPYTITISNQPPDKPAKPSGSTKGKINVEYTFTSNTSDSDGDQVFYWFDWGDDTNSGWVGPYNSGLTAGAKHSWTIKGTYQIKVKVKDVHNYESDWSDPLSVTIPRNRSFDKLLLRFIEDHPLLFKISQLLFKGLQV